MKTILMERMSLIWGFLSIDVVMNAMNFHVERLEEQGRELSGERESLRVTKEAIMSLPRNRLRRKRSFKAMKKL